MVGQASLRRQLPLLPLLVVVVVVAGGASANDLLMQMQADFLQAPVIRPAYQESTALGAAFAAGLGIGLWDEGFVFGGPSTSSSSSTSSTFSPALSPEDLAPRFSKWQDAVKRSFGLA